MGDSGGGVVCYSFSQFANRTYTLYTFLSSGFFEEQVNVSTRVASLHQLPVIWFTSPLSSCVSTRLVGKVFQIAGALVRFRCLICLLVERSSERNRFLLLGVFSLGGCVSKAS